MIGVRLAVLVLAVTAAGCAMTRQTRTVAPAGFLKDYSQLKEGGQGEAQLVYLNPRAEWSKYRKIQIDPVTIWVTDGSSLESVPEEDRQLLADYLHEAVHTELSKEYRIVREPAPDALRVRLAITDAKGASVVGNTVSKFVPQLRVLTTVGGLATDTQALVGRVGIEGELLDSMTDERLGAAVDRRAGTKAIRSGMSTWADVQRASDYWAERLRTRLAELRAR